MEFNDLIKVRHIYMMPESVFKANSEIVEKHGSIIMTRREELQRSPMVRNNSVKV
jgi:phage terminase small subunit